MNINAVNGTGSQIEQNSIRSLFSGNTSSQEENVLKSLSRFKTNIKGLAQGGAPEDNRRATGEDDGNVKVSNEEILPEFSYNYEARRVVIKVRNRNTDEVIREIPSEKDLKRIANAMRNSGILVDEKR